MIANTTIEEIKSKTSIVEVISEYVKLKKRGADYEGLCPFHQEKTPSFKVSPSKDLFKCFGCGKSGDSVSFLMEHEKLTYLDAIKRLADKYKVPIEEYEFKKKEFIKPVARLEKLSKPLIQWFETKRKISNNTLLRFKVTEAKEWMPKAEKEVPAICFNYYRNDELVNIKFRANGKDFKLAKDAELIFYNLDAIKDLKECIIVEGEIDCMSYHECNIYNSTSVPNGASIKGDINLEYLDNCWESFADKERIIISVDDDATGIKLKNELARRLGYERCWTVVYPSDKIVFDEKKNIKRACKDPNEVLVHFGPQALNDMYQNAEPWPIEGIITVESMADEVLNFYKNGYPNGYAVNIEGIGQKNMQLMLGQFTTLTGIPGSGKSEFADLLMVKMSKDHGWIWGIVSPENQPSSLHVTKLVQKYCGKSFEHRDNAAYRIHPMELPEAIDFVNSHFLFININEVDMSLPGLMDKMEELVGRKGIKGFLIDPWNKVRHDKIDVDYLRNSLNLISYRIKKSGVHLLLVAHPTKIEKEKRNGKDVYKIPTLYNISGGADFYNQTDNGITIYRDYETGIVTAYRQKIRYSWLGEIGWSAYKYNTLINQYEFVESSAKKESSSWVPLPNQNNGEAKLFINQGNSLEDEVDDGLPF